jgi:hypothetical protein
VIGLSYNPTTAAGRELLTARREVARNLVRIKRRRVSMAEVDAACARAWWRLSDEALRKLYRAIAARSRRARARGPRAFACYCAERFKR